MLELIMSVLVLMSLVVVAVRGSDVVELVTVSNVAPSVRQPVTTVTVEPYTAIEIAMDLYRDVENTESFTNLVLGMKVIGYNFDLLEVAIANEMLTRGEVTFKAICIRTGVVHTCAEAPAVTVTIVTGVVHTCVLPVVEVKEVDPRKFDLTDVVECRDWVLSLKEEFIAKTEPEWLENITFIHCFYHTKHKEAGYKYYYALNKGSNIMIKDIVEVTFSEYLEVV